MNAQIGDLLAQISGGQPTATPAPVIQRSNTIPKRRADDELSGSASKVPRIANPATPKVFPPAVRPTPSRLPSNGQASRPILPVKRPSDAANVTKPPASGSVAANGPPAVAKAPPKKGSFAEIMARAQRAQTVMGQVGKIQHKKVEGGSISKRKEEAKLAPKGPTNARDRKPSGYAGSSRLVKPTSGISAHNGARNGADPRSKNGSANKLGPAKVAGPEPEKKIKKAAQATTGYTGTARPKPGASVKKNNAARGGALLNEPRPRPSASKRSRYEDDYDEDLDDFIDNDEEDEGPRYDYASDASSDMEAGLSDIDVEERRAEIIARREDIEEERRENARKAAKEERKRSALRR